MKNLFKIILISLICLTWAITASANESRIKTAHYGSPDHMYGDEYRHSNFKVADLDLDGTSEIILLQGNVLTILDNAGKVVLTKQIGNITTCCGWNYPEGSNIDGPATKEYYGPHHGGPGRGYPGDDDYYGDHMGRGTGLDVANFDDDDNPEIIILNFDELIVLDHNGDLETTIQLPDTVYPY